MLVTAELLLPASESSCGLHTLGGPEQIVPLPLASFRADRLISSPRQALFPMFLELGWECVGGRLRVLCWVCHLPCMASLQECLLKWCILSLASVPATFLWLSSPDDGCILSNTPSRCTWRGWALWIPAQCPAEMLTQSLLKG